MYGAEKLQELVRHHIALGEWLAEQIKADTRWVHTLLQGHKGPAVARWPTGCLGALSRCCKSDGLRTGPIAEDRLLQQ
jgi:hypothetical protein